MPVVLATAEGRASSGYTYDDRTGISYEYPLKYQKLIFAGEAFVYHIAGSGYTGSGIVGDIAQSSNDGRLICEIENYVVFSEPVPLKDADGSYFEAKPGVPAPYWSQGVRPISLAAYEQIVWSAVSEAKDAGLGVSGYASPEVAVLVESISVRAAQAWLKLHYPHS